MRTEGMTPRRSKPSPGAAAIPCRPTRRALGLTLLLAGVWSWPPPAAASDGPLAALRTHLARPRADRGPVARQPFARIPLSREDAAAAARDLWRDHVAFIREDRKAELESQAFVLGEHRLRFLARRFGRRPEQGYDLFLSLHGGGSAPAAVNDGQWRNQIRLYQVDQGIIVAPRAPTDAWNMWFQPQMDELYDRLIETFVALGLVNPNRVYLLGYSAGGDGVYQMGPRMADRWAAAAMMAGHPNDASPLNLRNTPFAVHVGEHDRDFRRNEVALAWKAAHNAVAGRDPDPEAYVHLVKLHPGKGHWMDSEDREAIPWLQRFTRNPLPAVVVWRQDGEIMPRLSWLAVARDRVAAGDTIRAARTGQTITLQSDKPFPVRVRLNDLMLDLDEPVEISGPGYVPFAGRVPRTIATLATSLEERGDPASLFVAEVEMAVAHDGPR